MQIIADWFNNFIALMSTFRFNDFIDILIISLLIYSILKLIRDTRAEQLLKGLLFIFVILTHNNHERIDFYEKIT